MIKRLTILLALGTALLPSASAQVSKSTLNTNVASTFPDNTSGSITPAAVRSFLSTLIASFQQYPAVNAQVGVTYTFSTLDYGQLVTFNNAGAVAVALPAPGTAGFNPWNVYARNRGAGTVTITSGGGSTINGAATLALTTNQFTWIVSDGTNYQLGIGP